MSPPSISAYKQLSSNGFGSNNWCLNLLPIYSHALLTSLSNGEVHHLDWTTGKTKQVTEIGDTPCNDLKVINGDFQGGSLYAVASVDSVKIFDIRSQNPVSTLKNEKKAPFLSLDSRNDFLACGCELSGVDAEIHLYDIKKWETPVRSFVDSHHDDVTDLNFHPSDKRLLLSGSTDGYANIYDLSQQDEEDALHQVINFASIHSCGWLSPNRIYTLSHMETFAIHELNDRSDEPREPEPLNFGDVRESWGCSYVIDIFPGYIAAGSSQEDFGFLKILPFENEKVDIANAIVIPSAHGDDVVRDVLIPPNNSDVLYTCGEDGYVRVWKNEAAALKVPASFWDYSQKINALEDMTQESPQEKSGEIGNYERSQEEVIETRKISKKHKKKSKSPRYRPY